MKWQFKISAGLNSFSLEAEVIYTSYQIEQISVNGDGMSIVLQGNRPLLEAIELKRPITWKIIEGQVKNELVLNQVANEVEKYLTNKNEAPYINSQKDYKGVKKSA